MKEFICPVCNQKISLNNLSGTFISTLNEADTIFKSPFRFGGYFFRKGSGPQISCQSCKTKLYFDWGSQSFKKGTIPKRNYVLQRTKKQPLIIVLICIILAIILSWVLTSFYMKGYIQ